MTACHIFSYTRYHTMSHSLPISPISPTGLLYSFFSPPTPFYLSAPPTPLERYQMLHAGKLGEKAVSHATQRSLSVLLIEDGRGCLITSKLCKFCWEWATTGAQWNFYVSTLYRGRARGLVPLGRKGVKGESVGPPLMLLARTHSSLHSATLRTWVSSFATSRVQTVSVWDGSALFTLSRYMFEPPRALDISQCLHVFHLAE